MKSMLCPVLVDRGPELASLTSALDGAAHGAGGVSFLTGDAGVGKSRLAREIATLAAERGFHVLTGRATESVVPVPFRPIAEALMRASRAGMMADAPEMATYRATLGSLVPEWRRERDTEADISAIMLAEALLRLLTTPRWTGALLILEDLHWADPETLAILEYLADNLVATRVLLVATVRHGEPSAGLDAVRSISARRAATTIEIRRLKERSVRQMASACLETGDVPADVLRLLADCDGLPFAVEEILAAAISSGQLVNDSGSWHVNEGIQTALPASIVGSVRNRLVGLGPAVSDVLASAAVLGKQFDWTLLPQVTQASETQVLGALQQAQDVQLIEPVGGGLGLFRFRHSLTRHAILTDLLPPDLARRSARAADAIEAAHPDLPAAWCELAAELHEAAGDQARAAVLMLRVGGRALRLGALGTAIASLRDAKDLLGEVPAADPMVAIDIEEALVHALALAGDYDQLAPVADELLARLDRAGAADPRRAAQIRLTTARTRSEDHPVAAAEHLAAARSIANDLEDKALLSQVDAVAAHCAFDAGDIEKGGRLALRSLTSAEAAGLEGWAAQVAIESLEVIGRRERLRDIGAARVAFERAYQIAGDAELAVQRIRVLHELGTIDMLEDGKTERLSEARDLASRAGAISTATVIDLQLANTWSLGTDLDQALSASLACQQGAHRIGAKRIEAIATNIQALVAAIRGDRAETEQIAERAERTMPGDPEVLFSTWGLSRVTASLFLDDLPRALAESESGLSYGGRMAMLSPRRGWGNYALLQAVFDRDGHGAISEARAAGAAVGWNHGYLCYAEAVLEGRDGNKGGADALASRGADLLNPYAAWWNHLARRIVAPAALDSGWGQPVAWLREATAEFEATGHAKLASACRGILRKAGERVPRSGRGNAQVPPQMRRLGITSREMDVFLLVARGFSNSEIAERLFISTKTVETHIANLVTKTGQAGRRELVAHAARFTPP
jgi:DNA-binding CsgD family transcriptional regulator